MIKLLHAKVYSSIQISNKIQRSGKCFLLTKFIVLFICTEGKKDNKDDYKSFISLKMSREFQLEFNNDVNRNINAWIV